MGVDRTSIEDKFKWNIDTMYQSNESIKDDIDKVNSIIEELKSYKGKISSSKENLYKVLSNSEKASRILQNLYVYTHMKQHEDTRNNENQARATKAEMLSTELSMATSYIVPEIIAMDENKLKEKLIDLNIDKKYKKIYTANIIAGGLRSE
ncbi:hypothetical protein [Blautia obeum]|uniref:hypothetical protein n=1 Tax=Blautia obeum TaxID=40520 RepID=UPI00319E2ED4